MSYASQKGYSAEHAVVEYLRSHGHHVDRPRTTSRRASDTGDIRGMPFVVSVKNHARIQLAECVDELNDMVTRSPWPTGLLVHKRIGRGLPRDWYVTASLGLLMPMVDCYAAYWHLAQPRH